MDSEPSSNVPPAAAAPAAPAPAPAAAAAPAAPAGRGPFQGARPAFAPKGAPGPQGPQGPSGPGRMAALAAASRDTLGRFTKVASGNVGAILTGLIAASLVAFGVAFALYWLINRYLISKKSFLVPQSRYPVVGTEYSKLMADGIPSAGNGKRTAITFWIYVHDLDKFKGTMRHVFHRGDQTIVDASPSPVVFLDSDTNKLHIGFSPVKSTSTATTAATLATHLVQNHGITIDYIPLQRWVHVAVVVNENSNSGNIMAYVDGELVKIRKSKEAYSSTVATPLEMQNLQLDRSGNIWVGGSMTEDAGPGFSGLVSKIKFYNYDVNAKDVYNDYMSGPIDSLLAKMGLPVYGVRSPVYKLG